MRPVSGAKAAARVAARRRDRGSAIAEASTPSMRFTKKMQTGSFSPAGRGDAEPSGKTRCGIEAIDVIRRRRFVIQFHRICCTAEIMPQVVVFKGYIERAMGCFICALDRWPGRRPIDFDYLLVLIHDFPMRKHICPRPARRDVIEFFVDMRLRSGERHRAAQKFE